MHPVCVCVSAVKSNEPLFTVSFSPSYCCSCFPASLFTLSSLSLENVNSSRIGFTEMRRKQVTVASGCEKVDPLTSCKWKMQSSDIKFLLLTPVHWCVLLFSRSLYFHRSAHTSASCVTCCLIACRKRRVKEEREEEEEETSFSPPACLSSDQLTVQLTSASASHADRCTIDGRMMR